MANCMVVRASQNPSNYQKRVEISQKTGKIEIKSLREGLAETTVNYQREVGVNEY